jgi:hypothetical protein
VNHRAIEPPGGEAPPSVAWLDGDEPLDLVELSREVCHRYRDEFPDEEERYGPAGVSWCIHDNQWLLSWAAESMTDYLDMHAEVQWLASVLEARGFPLDRLCRDLEIAAEVVLNQVCSTLGKQLSGVLVDAAEFVRSRGTFLD